MTAKSKTQKTREVRLKRGKFAKPKIPPTPIKEQHEPNRARSGA